MLEEIIMKKVQSMKLTFAYINTYKQSMKFLWNDYEQPEYFMDNKLVVLGSCKEAKPVEQGVTIYPNT